jgi:rare lipoprotein A
MRTSTAAALCLALGMSVTGPARAEEEGRALRAEPQRGAAARAGDPSGRVQRGRASYYGREFNGRRMANGRPFRPESQAAASKTLPLGTTARVTNRETGRSTTVRVEDRGPHVPGRVLDVSPRAAQQLGMGREGVAPVEIAPIEVPQPDGSVRPGAGAGAGGGATPPGRR